MDYYNYYKLLTLFLLLFAFVFWRISILHGRLALVWQALAHLEEKKENKKGKS